MTSDLFLQSHHFLIGKADFFKLEAVILFSSFLQQQSGVFIGVWVLPTRTNEQTGRQAGTLISPLCMDSGCACCSLKSHIRKTRCFRSFQDREHFIFTFSGRPLFFSEKMSVVKWKEFLGIPPNSQKFVRCKVRGTNLWRENFIPAVPANRRKECPL